VNRMQQSRLYGPVWTACWRANWTKDAGRIVPKPGRSEPTGGLPTPTDVEDMAGRIAAREQRDVTEADLRRAARYLALGRDVPSGANLNDADLDRVLALFRLLSAPDAIAPIVAWENPDEAQRARIVRGLRHCGVPEGLMRSWCNHFNPEHGGDWPSLPAAKLQGFSRYVWGRVKTKRAKGKRQKVERTKA